MKTNLVQGLNAIEIECFIANHFKIELFSVNVIKPGVNLAAKLRQNMADAGL